MRSASPVETTCRLNAALLAGALVLLFLRPPGSVHAQHRPASDQAVLPAVEDASRPFALSSVVKSTLLEGTAVLSSREEVRAAHGRLRAARGAFDVRMDASLSIALDNTLYTQAQQQQNGISRANRGLSNYEAGVSKRFQSGLVVRPNVSVSRTDAFTLSSAPVLRKEVALAASYPLMRGRGQTMAAAEADAARRSLQAGRFSLRHAAARSLRDATYAYWDYRAAHERLRVLRGSEERARTLLRETKALVEAGERPESALSSLQANLADQVAARVGAEQSLREARRELGLEMGVPAGEISTLPAPTEAFPAVEGAPPLPSHARLVEEALAGRADLRGASTRAEAAHSLLEAQRSAAKPRLDLQAEVGYASLSDGQGLSVFQHAPPLGQSDTGGPTVSLGISYAFPLGNNEARGRLTQQQTAYQQRQITTRDLRRRVRSGVSVALEALESSRESVERTREAVQSYRIAVEDERKKLRHGMSTLLDVTTVEDRLTNALSGLISAQTRYAKALARLRYETGTLLLSHPLKKIANRPHVQARRLQSAPAGE